MLPQLVRVVCILQRMGHALHSGDTLVCCCHTYVSILIAGLRFMVQAVRNESRYAMLRLMLHLGWLLGCVLLKGQSSFSRLRFIKLGC